jgi:hypothetical protein
MPREKIIIRSSVPEHIFREACKRVGRISWIQTLPSGGEETRWYYVWGYPEALYYLGIELGPYEKVKFV